MKMKSVSIPVFSILIFAISAMTTGLLSGCRNEDPTPVNEEEVITTLEISFTPQGGGIPLTLKFYDADGEQGSIPPVITSSGPLKAATIYLVRIGLTNETVQPHGDISAEVAEEANDHLFCFNVDGNISITYEDADGNGLPLGLETLWETTGPGAAAVTVSLRHQAGTKTGDCPGSGETDVEVMFDVVIE